jgi:thiol-disulfide isomerase/thioredoxin
MTWTRAATPAGLVALALLSSTSSASSLGPRSWSFQRSVVNLESYSGSLQPEAPPSIHHGAPADSTVWFGEIFRQLPGDVPTSRKHAVPFAVRLEAGVATRAWADANLDGELTDDDAPVLSVYPGEPGTRSFLIPLKWSVRVEGRDISIERLVRIVIDPPTDSDRASGYRIQDVYGMLGRVEIEGAARRAVLFDANHDGLFTRGHGDGVFIDLDGDKQFVIDPMAMDFGPFAIPFTILGRAMAVDSVTWDGSRLLVRDMGPAAPQRAPARGLPAPDFSFVDMEGHLQRLSAHRGRTTVVYFWASWCANCRGIALELRGVLERPGRKDWDILGINLDTERADALRFRHEFGETFPSSFAGGYTSENPVARLYQEAMVGVFYVVGPDGVLADKVTNVDDLKAALAKLSSNVAGSGR